jgi:hypothetical protein
LNVHVVLDFHVDGFTSKVCSVDCLLLINSIYVLLFFIDELKYTCVQLGDIPDKYLMFP